VSSTTKSSRSPRSGCDAFRTEVKSFLAELTSDPWGERGYEGDSTKGCNRSRPANSGVTRGFWADVEWIPCTDGKARPVEPGTFPLAYGVAGRVGLLRAYGNAIVEPLATAFIEAVMEIL
jgi:hypothetical protein